MSGSRLYGALGAIFGLTAVAGVLHYTDAKPVVVFIVAAVALAGLAWAVGIGTESVGARFGPAVQVQTGRIFVIVLTVVAYCIAMTAPQSIFDIASQRGFRGVATSRDRAAANDACQAV